MHRLFILLFALTLATPSFAARCGGDFNTFVASISADAQAAGISQSVVGAALGGVQQDMAVLNFDRRQRGTFNKSFEQYVSTRVGPGRINTGRGMLSHALRSHAPAAISARVEASLQVLCPGSTSQARERPHDQEQATYDGHDPDLGNARMCEPTS
jgi:membrane-bound lytic murein transglycosylase B